MILVRVLCTYHPAQPDPANTQHCIFNMFFSLPQMPFDIIVALLCVHFHCFARTCFVTCEWDPPCHYGIMSLPPDKRLRIQVSRFFVVCELNWLGGLNLSHWLNNANSELDLSVQRNAALVQILETPFPSDPTVRSRSSGTGLNLSDRTSSTNVSLELPITKITSTLLVLLYNQQVDG